VSTSVGPARLHDAEAFSHESLEAGAPDEVVGQLFAGEHIERGEAGVGDHLRGFVDGERAVLGDGLHDEVHHHLQAAEEASFFLGFGGEVGVGRGGCGGDVGLGQSRLLFAREALRRGRQRILRCAQDDRQKGKCNGCVAVVLSLRRCGNRGDSAVGGEEKGFRSAAIGAEGLDVGVFEAPENLWARVAEGVVAAHADNGFVRVYGGEEVWGCRSAAAMVADFEQRGGGDAAVFQHSFLAGRFGVAFEEDAGAVVVEPQDEGIVVYGGTGVGVSEFGREDAGVEIGPEEGFAGVEVADEDVLGVGLGEEGAEERRVAGVDADPELAGVEVTEDGGHASHVVGVSVGEENDVEAADVARPEVRGNDFFADIPRADGSVGTTAGGASGVDEDGLADGADDEQRIALADIDGSYF
jgi:hypothetical protein